ncbi:MAG: flagellar hook-associated protein FlgK [Lachnospiraceae bacterium]|nr:flagellar hook-associated protein FlgK [Lachnospiraceae bacterium]
MISTFYGLTIAYSGLNAYQAALNTTGHNISNVETEGYCRQYVNQTAADALRTYSQAGMQGGGVTVTGIEQMRNVYYDYKYWANNAKLGEANSHYYYMLQIENYFKGSTTADSGNVATAEDFSSLFSNMFNSLEEVMKNPSNTSYRNNFIHTAQCFTEYFNNAYTNLQKLQEDCNLELKSKIHEINSIAEQIATLNKQINVVEAHGDTANDLRDKRALLIDKLSVIVPTEIEEVPVVDSNNPDRYTHINTCYVKIAGQTLVSGTDYNTLELKSRDAYSGANQTDVQGLYTVEWSNGLEFNQNNERMGGQLKALFDIRDGNNQENFQGSIQSVDEAERTFTVSADSVPEVYKDVYGINIPEQGLIKVNNIQLVYDSFTFNADGSYTFHIKENTTGITAGMVGGEVSIGESVDYMGIPYYMSQINEFARKFAEAFNEIHSGNEDLNGDVVGNFFTGIDPVDGTELGLKEGVATGSDSYYRLTAANISVKNAYLKDSSLLATTGQVVEGVEQIDVLEKLYALRKQPNFYNGGTTEEFLECIITDIALDTKTAFTLGENYQNIGDTIEQQRMSISGVDNDEEALNLVKYQNAYNLSAKMMSIMTEIYDRLILQTGV